MHDRKNDVVPNLDNIGKELSNGINAKTVARINPAVGLMTSETW